MTVKSRGALCAAAALLVLSPALMAKEIKVKAADVPGAIMDTLNVHYPAAKFLGFSKEMESGSTLFEAEMKVDGRHVDALLDSVGTIREEETALSVDELRPRSEPLWASPSTPGARSRARSATSFPGPGKRPSYELHVELRDKSYELVFVRKGVCAWQEDPHVKDFPS